jgi:hypothetical protein
VRRDVVEHLILTGGPVDVVIETGIASRSVSPPDVLEKQAVFSRPIRSLGQAAGGEK